MTDEEEDISEAQDKDGTEVRNGLKDLPYVGDDGTSRYLLSVSCELLFTFSGEYPT
jgi:hypothetical protein